MFVEIDLLPVYDSEHFNIIRDLQIPLLDNSVDYLRGVGFFTSGWLSLAAQGLAGLISNGGKARIVLSPILEESDWDALKRGDAAKNDEALRVVLSKNMDDIKVSLELDTLNALAWMVADGIIEFRFAVSRKKIQGVDYHDKVAIFKDDRGDVVAIHGSFNDSIKASMNGEAFSVFKSWESGQRQYVESHQYRLENLWNNLNRQFITYQIPEIIKENFIKLRTSRVRPYQLMETHETEIKKIVCKVDLHDYQKEAIEKWSLAGYRGIFDMATGTGKTITSLAAATKVYNELARIIVIVLVPYLHLVEQWDIECRKFGFDPILCSSVHKHWQINVKTAIQNFQIKVNSAVCLIAVHNTAASEKFKNAIKRIPGKNTLLIGDEVHGLGSGHLRNALIPNVNLRIGLSATPRRWFDDEGTDILINYFGEICFEFSLEKAIGKFLTPYEYYPQLISLTGDELILYEELTEKIKSLSCVKELNYENNERLKMLFLKRSRLLSTAKNKIPALLKILSELLTDFEKKGEAPKGILIYCAPGEHRNVLKEVSKTGLKCHEFVHDVNLHDREEVLSQFENGLIQILVAIKCLDEGVDVPATQAAFILASSTNPREFVQRRGRILRRSKGKVQALIYDFLVAPEYGTIKNENDSYISILKREMPRFVEFSSSASNQFDARSKIRDILDYYHLLNLLDEKPWDVYHSLKEADWSNESEK